MMDLQWQRQSELWLRLMDAQGASASSNLAIRLGRDTFYLEQHTGRARLALSRPIRREQGQATLLRLLGLLQPEAGGGVPLRAWIARGCLWLAATAPQDSGAEHWASLSRQQRRLMDRVMEDSHEKDQ
ncbi:hypothetical protein [Chromobacterium sinusclupearum]|nr:hypothetical protein [Chromobacterium sinusclupearum]